MAEDFGRNLPEEVENTTVKEMFPNLAIVKKEIQNYYDSEFESTPISVQYDNFCEDKKPILHEEIDSTTFKPLCAESPEAKNSQNNLIKCNKIILGSRPNRVSVDDDDFDAIDENLPQELLNRVSIDANYFEELVTPYKLNVVLQDVQSYLYKSKRFCKICSILFPEPGSYEIHVQTIHTETLTAGKSHTKKVRTIHSQHKCTICSKYFVAAHVLRRHMKNIHKCNDTELTKTKKPDATNVGLHLEPFESSTHDETGLHDEYFKSSNKCSHCKNTFETQKSLIEHLYDILQMKRKKTEIVPVLKSILFKCNKCDIHFTSSQVAADHAEHMEMLINWKCGICNRIFKKEDELSHERQHSVSNTFLVYNLEGIDATKILFKCSKCGTHFAESNFLYHFRDCSLEVTKSVHCKICDLLLDYNLKSSHESDIHTDLHHFTIIETDVISDNPVNTREDVKESPVTNKFSELLKSFREVKVVLKKIDSNKLNEHNESAKETFDKMSVSSEEEATGKTPDVLGDKSTKKLSQRRLTTIKKQKFKRHGNMGPENTLRVEIGKKPTLLDDDINVSNVMNRKNKLAYFYCETCKCFITSFRTNAHRQSRCLKYGKVTCKLCGLILTTRSIKTHTRLHKKYKDLKLNNFSFYNLYDGQSMNPPIPEYPKCVGCAVHFLSKEASNNHICRETYLTCQLCEMKFSETAFKCHMSFHHYSTSGIKRSKSSKRLQPTIMAHIERDAMDPTNNEIELQNSVDVDDTPASSSADTYEIIYTCANCSVSVDTYDKVVEHCQGHYKVEVNEIPTEFCNDCNLNIEKTSFTEHYKLHERGMELKVLKFDSYYFPVENHMWVNHVFKTLPNKKVFDILSKSIYRFECRIKMDVVQQGDPSLTIYKCDQCSCFIEPASLFKHADNSCFKLRQHLCTWCGLPFISSASRIDHEKIHKRSGITINSFRIVVFNRAQDKQMNRSFCLHKTYVLYKCRNCSVIIDKAQREIHECDITNLNTKECPDCALLLYSQDYERHVKAHKELISFNYSNMKVILLGGDNIHSSRSENNCKSKFQGAVRDYKMFICNKCEIIIKDEKCMPNHICHFGRQRSKCLKCGLFFSMGRLKTHTRAHERDPDFVRSNMNLVSFDPCNFDQNENARSSKRTEECKLSDSNTDSDSDSAMVDNDTRIKYAEITKVPTETITEETVKVYKCPCGLHFLNEDSIFRHFGVCRSKAKISKQKCPKCDLLFTPNILFTHLLAHHSNKSRRYKYDIIDMDNTQKSKLL